MHNEKIEKAQDFKGSIMRLFKELKSFKLIIIVSLLLAIFSSILTIFTPNKLSSLTDEISKGLVINTKNMTKLTDNLNESMNEEVMSKTLPVIINLDISNDSLNNIMSNNTISSEDKIKLQTVMSNLSINDKTKIFNSIGSLPDSVLKEMLSETTYNNILVSVEDKISLLRMMNKSSFNLPKSIGNILFKEVVIDGKKISIEDQVKFTNVLSSLDKNSQNIDAYKKLDTLPKSIRTILEPNMNLKIIKSISLLLVFIYMLSALFNYVEAIIMTNVSNKFAKSLRNKISLKINKLPLKYFDNHATGDILSRVTNDVDTIAQSMNQSLSTLVSSLTLFLGTIIMMFITNWIMAITAIVSSLFGFIFMAGVLSKSQKYFIEKQTELGNINGHIEEIYSSLNVVKAYNGKKESDKKFDQLNSKLYNASRKSQFLSGLMMPMMNFIGNFGYVAVCIVGALLAMNGNITFGIIVAFITYVRLFTSPLSQIAQALTSLQSTAAASERVFIFVDEKEMSKETNFKKRLNKSSAKGNIEFKNIVFKYDGNDKPTIKNFSASVKSGEKIAIVGPTGAGKTTMVNLLMKFYEINEGDIIIDGISTKDLTRDNIHELFTMVLQDTWLFEGTIRDNIVYNNKKVSKKEIDEVCDTVGIDHFINTLPNGMDSIISDNDSVSAGQRQLLTLARGMINTSPFIILDEATSNVDTRTEELVSKAMDKLTEGKTSFIIAHRLSTIKNADLILVMKDGNIVEQGSHKVLMKQNGFYAELYNSQFKL